MKKLGTWMESLTDWMTDEFAPRANKVTGNLWVKALQEAIMAVVPMILVGSLITLVSILNNFFSWMPNLTPINQFSFGLMGLFVAFLIPYHVMQHKDFRDRRLVAGMAGVAVFLMLIGPTFSEDGGSITFTFERFGATGMFTSILAGLAVAAVFNLFAKLKMFKNSTALPDFIIVWFDSMLPILLSLLVTWLLVDVAHLDIYAGLLAIFSPLTAIVQSFWGFVILYFIGAFLYSFGMSAWILFPIVYPLQLQGIQDNMAAVAAGHPATNINTYEVLYSGWVGIGGIGATLPLVIMMAFWARSARLKAIGRASLAPSIFNINEPIVFGAPIAFNPILMVPFWINSIVPPVLTYWALSSGLVPIPSQLFQMWYTPFPFATWIVSPGLASMVLLAVITALVTLTWLPFFRAYDRQAVAEDEAEEAEELNAADTAGAAA
ncbi:MAG: PTS transporter subunit EIIC [Propionicimonas sp.]|uniref:PTS sugar transporter subunit IIC n=1 Tax=Propionicimonas sp. TaxID=1955623 RepID=UPI003D13C30F